MSFSITIGTRGSKLALYQAHRVKKELEQVHADIFCKIKVIETKGDKILDTALSKIGDKGLFTKELEIALAEGEVDIAVHSLKDLPTNLEQGFQIGAVLQRGDCRDALVSKNGLKLADLTEQHVLATSSLRRKAGVLHRHPYLQIKDIRGNVLTRLKKMEDGYCDAMVMAAAGLQRLGLEEYVTEYLEVTHIIPAVSQGIIAVEIREDDHETESILRPIHHIPTAFEATAERSFMRSLMGGCQVPIGCYTLHNGNSLSLRGFVASTDGKQYLYGEAQGDEQDAIQVGDKLATTLIAQGAMGILDAIRQD